MFHIFKVKNFMYYRLYLRQKVWWLGLPEIRILSKIFILVKIDVPKIVHLATKLFLFETSKARVLQTLFVSIISMLQVHSCNVIEFVYTTYMYEGNILEKKVFIEITY